MIAIGQFFFRFRNAIFPLVMVLAVLLSRPLYSYGSNGADLLVDLLGIAVILAGQALRVATIGYEYIRRGGRDGRVYAESLVQGGLFAHCRNPLYVGNILMAIGFLIVIGQGWLIVAGTAVVVFVYSAIVAAEEDFLSREFGAEYDRYRERVNRWIPDPRGLRESLARMRFNWQRVLVKEYNTLFAVLGALLLTQAWTHLGEGAMSDARWAWLMVGSGLLIAAYLLVRGLKKRQVLHA
jgi:protein-S-isoprenylcysteine O-methyltransferase Ste14